MKFIILCFFVTSLIYGKTTASKTRRYLLYDVNTGEGFNLRRDVYIRMANLIRFVDDQDEKSEWSLVLPPWSRLYHWFNSRETEIAVPWSNFFHFPSLQLFIRVIELEDYLKENPSGKVVDEVYYLQHFKDFGTNWDERAAIEECNANHDYSHLYEKESNEPNALWTGYFFSKSDMRAKQFNCLSIQMEAHNFKNFLLQNTTGTSILIDRAENLHHGTYSEWSPEWWTARRSMVFSRRLRKIAREFINQKFNCATDKNSIREEFHRPENWTTSNVKSGTTKGCGYLSTHLRRRDFLYAHEHTTPDLNNTALQIQFYLKKLDQNMPVFIATDAPDDEIDQIRKFAPNLRFETFKDDSLTDGDRAIIDQIICSYARNFLATSTSTFSYRILEEREIMGFGKKEKGAAFCHSLERAKTRLGLLDRNQKEQEEDEKLSAEERCDQPTHWPVQFEAKYSSHNTKHTEL